MKKLLLIGALLLCFPVFVSAQDSPKGELFGGYSYLRVEGENLNGWNASVAGNAGKYFSIVADFGGYYPDGGKIHTFLFGPRFSYRGTNKAIPFVHALFGVARASNGGSDSIFSMAVGGGLDFKVAPRLAVRLPQLDYVMARDAGETTNAVRLSVGLVVHF